MTNVDFPYQEECDLAKLLLRSSSVTVQNVRRFAFMTWWWRPLRASAVWSVCISPLPSRLHYALLLYISINSTPLAIQVKFSGLKATGVTGTLQRQWVDGDRRVSSRSYCFLCWRTEMFAAGLYCGWAPRCGIRSEQWQCRLWPAEHFTIVSLSKEFHSLIITVLKIHTVMLSPKLVKAKWITLIKTVFVKFCFLMFNHIFSHRMIWFISYETKNLRIHWRKSGPLDTGSRQQG